MLSISLLQTQLDAGKDNAGDSARFSVGDGRTFLNVLGRALDSSQDVMQALDVAAVLDGDEVKDDKQTKGMALETELAVEISESEPLKKGEDEILDERSECDIGDDDLVSQTYSHLIAPQHAILARTSSGQEGHVEAGERLRAAPSQPQVDVLRAPLHAAQPLAHAAQADIAAQRVVKDVASEDLVDSKRESRAFSETRTQAGATSKIAVDAQSVERLAQRFVFNQAPVQEPDVQVRFGAILEAPNVTYSPAPSVGSVDGVAPNMAFSRSEANPLPHISNERWAQALNTQVATIAKSALTQGPQSIEMRLDPPELGPLRVSVSVDAGQVHVGLNSASPVVRTLIEQALPQLASSFSQSGLSLGGASVEGGEQHHSSGFDEQEPEGSAPSHSGGRQTLNMGSASDETDGQAQNEARQSEGGSFSAYA